MNRRSLRATFSRTFVCCAGALFLTPGLARAELALTAVQPFPPMSDRPYFDLVFAGDTAGADFPADEGLLVYDLSVVVPPGSRDKITLDGAERPDHFVLDVPGGATFSVAVNQPDRLLINVSGNTGTDLADINNGDKAARIFYRLDPAAQCTGLGLTVFDFDADATVFGSGDVNYPALQIPVSLSDSAVIFCPEPAAAAPLAAAALLALRRRERCGPDFPRK